MSNNNAPMTAKEILTQQLAITNSWVDTHSVKIEELKDQITQLETELSESRTRAKSITEALSKL